MQRTDQLVQFHEMQFLLHHQTLARCRIHCSERAGPQQQQAPEAPAAPPPRVDGVSRASQVLGGRRLAHHWHVCVPSTEPKPPAPARDRERSGGGFGWRNRGSQSDRQRRPGGKVERSPNRNTPRPESNQRASKPRNQDRNFGRRT